MITDFSKFLEHDMEESPPTDVKFVFKQEMGGVKEVTAHKMILAFGSDVFKREFYGSMKSMDEIKIKDASQEVFQVMVECIYNKEQQWEDFDLSFLASLYHLADKYMIDNLRSEIIASISNYISTEENVLDVAVLAEAYAHHHPLSETLFDAAKGFFMKKREHERFESIQEFLFTKENEKHSLAVFKVMERLKCKNCKQTMCLTGCPASRVVSTFLGGVYEALAYSASVRDHLDLPDVTL